MSAPVTADSPVSEKARPVPAGARAIGRYQGDVRQPTLSSGGIDSRPRAETLERSRRGGPRLCREGLRIRIAGLDDARSPTRGGCVRCPRSRAAAAPGRLGCRGAPGRDVARAAAARAHARHARGRRRARPRRPGVPATRCERDSAGGCRPPCCSPACRSLECRRSRGRRCSRCWPPVRWWCWPGSARACPGCCSRRSCSSSSSAPARARTCASGRRATSPTTSWWRTACCATTTSRSSGTTPRAATRPSTMPRSRRTTGFAGAVREIYSLHAVGLSLAILPAWALGGYPAVTVFMALLAALLVCETARVGGPGHGARRRWPRPRPGCSRSRRRCCTTRASCSRRCPPRSRSATGCGAAARCRWAPPARSPSAPPPRCCRG